MTSYGAKIFDLLPFVGSAEQDNVDYRQQVATVSWRLIKQHPFFGDPSALSQMEELRQGQGIIDLVNTYASISVFYGLVGCTLFVLCFAYPLLRTALALPSVAAVDTDGADLGGALAACMAGTLLMLATCSFGMGFEVLTWALAGMCSAYTAAMHTSLQAQQAAFVNERAPRARSSFHAAR